MDTMLDQLAAWRPFRAVVVGDFMLDQLLYGTADRLSADAPVPVLHVTRQEDTPGGAANLCLDLVALRGRVSGLGVVGQDTEAGLLRTNLMQQGVDASTLVTDLSRPTTVKRNLIGLAQGRHAQKMFRVDFESREPISAEIAERLVRALEDALPKTDVVCIEDYNKGVCTPAVCAAVIERARDAGIPVFVDPAPIADYSKYRGATVITPNRTEAERAAGVRLNEDASPDHAATLAERLLTDLELEACVVTLDRHGSVLVTRDDPAPIPVPTVARDVYDVTGAGDMMLAGLAAARANGLSWSRSVRFANAAAGLEVEVFGVAPIPFERVHAEVLDQHTSQAGKQRTLDQVVVQTAAARKQGKRVVFTNGCFDVLHAGHVTLLEKAARFGEFLVVGLNDDAGIRRLKGEGRPVNAQDRRARVLGALDAVDAVVLFADDTPIELIERIRPDVLVKGADYARDQVVGADIVESAGGRVELVELVEGLSTTATIERLRDG